MFGKSRSGVGEVAVLLEFGTELRERLFAVAFAFHTCEPGQPERKHKRMIKRLVPSLNGSRSNQDFCAQRFWNGILFLFRGGGGGGEGGRGLTNSKPKGLIFMTNGRISFIYIFLVGLCWGNVLGR